MKKITFLFILCCLISCSYNKNDPDRLREVLNFNDHWFFASDSLKQGIKDNWPDLGLPESREISAPHTWNVEKGLEDYYGWGWYQKKFSVDPSWKHSLIKIRFNAVFRDVVIWLNGHQLLERKGSGYTPFDVQLDPFMNFDTVNTLTLRVDNSYSLNAVPVLTSFDWPNDGGLIRDIELIKAPPLSINRVLISPVIKNNHSGIITLDILINSPDTTSPGSLDVWYQINFNGGKIAGGNQSLKVNDHRIRLSVELPEVKLWRFDNPSLYELRLAIGKGYSLLDHYTGAFGFRKLTTENTRLILNGEDVRLPGLEWMPGSDTMHGMAEDTSVFFRMLRLLKNTHAVLTRFHWQQDEKILNWCDQNGLLVQEELPMWARPYAEDLNDTIRQIVTGQISEMILSHYNHPSVIAWGIGNELQSDKKEIVEYLRDVRNTVRSLDTTRMVNYVSNRLHQSPKFDATTLGNIMMWNDYSGLWYALGNHPVTDKDLGSVLTAINRDNPGRCLVISEYGLCEPFFKGGDSRRITHLKYHNSVYDTTRFIGGVIYFCLNDYRTHIGEEGSGKLRRRVHGIVDIFGNKKASYDTLSELFSPVRIMEIRHIGNKIYIRGNNHNGLPSYALIDYRIKFRKSGAPDEQTFQLPDLFPGDKFTGVFDYGGPGSYQAQFISPGGWSVKNIKFILP